MKAQNEKEFKKLIKTYESLTEEMLLEKNNEEEAFWQALSEITGFGTFYCSLCGVIREQGKPIDCSKCVYGFQFPKSHNLHACHLDSNADSYNAICDTKSNKDLLTAIQNRAKHMREVWKLYLKQRYYDKSRT